MNAPTFRQQQGLSLVELMIAMLMGLILIAGLLRMLIYSKDQFITNTGLAQIQEAGRIATNMMAYDIRNAGYRSECSLTGITNHLVFDSNSVTSWPFDLGQRSLAGWDDGASITLNNTTPFGNTDAILLLHAATASNAVTSTNSLPSQNTIPLSSAGDIPEKQIYTSPILLLTDSTGCDLFQNTSSNTQELSISASSPPMPGNKDATFSHTYSASHMQIQLFRSVAYYISLQVSDSETATEPNLPALYRLKYSNGLENTSVTSEELVEGILDMQILYGLDQNNDQQADIYVRAGTNGLTVNSSGANNWNKVVAVQLSLLAISPQRNAAPRIEQAATEETETDPSQTGLQKIPFPAANDIYKNLGVVENEFAYYEYDTEHNVTYVTLKNHRLGQVFTTTVAIRNHML